MKYLSILTLLFAMPVAAVCQWTTDTLPSPREQMGAAVYVDDSISQFWYAGGLINNEQTASIDIYNANTGAWSTQTLSQARTFPAAAASGDYVVFAGGLLWTTFQPTGTVDLYHVPTGQWTTTELSQPRYVPGVAAYENTMLFAGGFDKWSNQIFDVVDILNLETQTWSTATLSQARYAMGTAVVTTPNGTVAMFAGGTTDNGPTDRVDIYNFTTGAWSTESLSSARSGVAGATLNGKVYFAGGVKENNVYVTTVDVYDPLTGGWTIEHISEPRTFATPGVTACDKIFFAGGGTWDLASGSWIWASGRVDIYDASDDAWTTHDLQYPVVSHAAGSDGKHVVIAGGLIKTPFQQYTTNNMEIYDCIQVSTKEVTGYTPSLRLYPNPAFDYVQVETQGNAGVQTVRIVDMSGKVVFTRTWNTAEKTLQLPAHLSPGLYHLMVGTEMGTLIIE